LRYVVDVLNTRRLLVLLVMGCIGFVLFAFTIVGLVGEALVLLSLVGLVARAIAMAPHRARHD
jgi:hypothetical protein